MRGTLASKAQLELELTPHLRNWKIARLPGVDRLVLDLCAWELRNRLEVEATTVINHAVELVRRMSSEESVAYVNAVLDAFAKSPARGALESEASAPLLLAASVSFTLFYLFGRQAFCNYYYLLDATVLFAAATLTD